ncbi:MAG: glycosyltransferase [Candidatus Aenigmarchaeota archaeon]|nr:glycosyltransferase [Candidatus Aenigmarchaeota archaeon]
MDKVDIIVGIPTYNEADNVSFVVKQVDRGLKKYYPGKKALIVDCDGKSRDRTKPVFLNTKTTAEKKFIETTSERSGKGNVFRMLFKLVRSLRPEATMVVDADLKSIKPEWLRLLVGPVLKGYDYVTPIYVRERYDGTITNHITYPVVYGLLGRNIRQPIAGDFAFSTRLANYWLKHRWTEEIGKYGIDIFMTTHAILGKFKICQASLGHKVHKSSEPKLSEMFLQVVTSLFDNVLKNKDKWPKNSRVREEKIFGIKTLPEPRKLKPDPENILQTTVTEYKKEKLKSYLSKEVFEKVNSMFFEREVDIDKELWASIIYDLMYAYHKGRRKRDIVMSMRSLYFGRIYTFFKKIPEYTTEEVEAEIRAQAECFRKKRKSFFKRIN